MKNIKRPLVKLVLTVAALLTNGVIDVSAGVSYHNDTINSTFESATDPSLNFWESGGSSDATQATISTAANVIDLSAGVAESGIVTADFTNNGLTIHYDFRGFNYSEFQGILRQGRISSSRFTFTGFDVPVTNVAFDSAIHADDIGSLWSLEIGFSVSHTADSITIVVPDALFSPVTDLNQVPLPSQLPFQTTTAHFTITQAVPEPSSAMMLLLVVGGIWRRNRVECAKLIGRTIGCR